jgi:hypothetical protein
MRKLQRRLALTGLPQRRDFDLEDDEDNDLQNPFLVDTTMVHSNSLADRSLQNRPAPSPRFYHLLMPCLYESRAFHRLFPLWSPNLVARLLHTSFIFVCIYVPFFLTCLVRLNVDLLTPLPVSGFLLPLLVLAYVFPSLLSNYVLVRFIGPLTDPEVLQAERLHHASYECSHYIN